jgi:hypothetical protein
LISGATDYGSWSDLPPVLALWVIGLGVEMHWNHPRCPDENPVIERSQGLAQTWGEPDQCQTVRQFQNRINREDRLQREQYPSIDGLPRMTAYPELKHSGRRYSTTWEHRHWNWDLVLTHLAGYAVQRQVDRSGKIGLYSGKLYVGTMHKGKKSVRSIRSRSYRVDCQRHARTTASHRPGQGNEASRRTHAELQTVLAKVNGQTFCRNFWTMDVAC